MFAEHRETERLLEEILAELKKLNNTPRPPIKPTSTLKPKG